MKILFENDYARLWLDGHSPILYSKVMAIPQKMDELKRVCSIYSQAIKDALKRYRKIYALSDFSEIQVTPDKQMIQFYANFLPGLKNEGVVFKAFVQPRGALERTLLIEIVARSAALKAATYDRFEEALSAINGHRQSERQEEKSILNRILMW